MHTNKHNFSIIIKLSTNFDIFPVSNNMISHEEEIDIEYIYSRKYKHFVAYSNQSFI